MNFKNRIIKLAQDADIGFNGEKPGDIIVNDERFYKRLFFHGSLGLGESYMENWWDCENLDIFFERLLSNFTPHTRMSFLALLRHTSHLFTNVQTIAQGKKLADISYNVSNEMFQEMLGSSMTYSCAYWHNANNLDDAQNAKFDLICKKLHLNKDDDVLEIGCGWGGFAKYASEKYGCHVTGVTISEKQNNFLQENYQNTKMDFHLCDYRHIPSKLQDKKYTKIVSIGMYEHVGYQNYQKFAEIANIMLEKHGLFLLHTIGKHVSDFRASDYWMDKYIFPGGMLPSMKQISKSLEGSFFIEHVQNIGVNYHKTLIAWFENFDNFWNNPTNLKHRPTIFGSEELFYRMWKYYLYGMSANFKIGASPVWQLVLSKKGVQNGYVFNE